MSAWQHIEMLPRGAMDCAVKGSEERGQQRSREDTEEVSGRKEQFQEAEFPVTHAHRLCLPLAIIQDRPGSTCSFPLMKFLARRSMQG